MNLLMVTSSYPLSDKDRSPAGNFVPYVARRLQEMGHTVAVVTQDKPGSPKADVMDVPVVRFPWRGSESGRALVHLNPCNPLNLPLLWSLLRESRNALLAVARQKRADIILALWALPGGLMARMAHRAGGPPYAVWCLGSDINVYGRNIVTRGIVRSVLAGSLCNFADGLQLCREVERIDGRPCDYLPTTRDLSRVIAAPPELESPAFHFLYVGRWEKVKGIDVLMDAWPQVAAHRKEARLHVIGSGSLKSLIEWKIAEHGAAGAVRLMENVSSETLKGYMERCHCMVIPSRMESIPVTFSEALQCGLPLIVTDVGDMGELVTKHQLGLVVKPGDADALAEAMMKFDPAVAESFRLKLPAARELFDPGIAAQRFISRLENILRLSEAST